MTLALAFVKFIVTDEIIHNINAQLNKIVNSCDLNQMEIGIPYDKVEIPEFEQSQIQHAKEIWEDIAKLSIDLFVDYQHYCQFLFKSRYTITEYELRLANLGFVIENGLWKSVRKPELKEVQTNMAMYFLYRIISEKIALKADNEVNEENERRRLELIVNSENIDRIVAHDNDNCETVKCQYCESVNSNENEICHICAGEIRRIIGTDSDDTLNGNGEVTAMECLPNYGNIRNQGNHYVCDNIDRNEGDKFGTCGQYLGENARDGEECGGLTVEVIGDNGLEDVKANEGKEQKKEILEGKELANEDRINEWRCGGCGLLNKYKLGDCEACGKLFKYGSWVCGRCKRENKCDMEECSDCKYKNNKIKEIADYRRGNDGRMENKDNEDSYDHGDLRGGVEEYKGVPLGQEDINNADNDYAMDNCGGQSNVDTEHEEDRNRIKMEDYISKWVCGKCGLLNEYTFITCDACAASFDGGRWTCGSCKKDNNCRDDKCSECDRRNDNKVMVGYVNNMLKNAKYTLVKDDKSGGIGATWNGDNGGMIPEDQWSCGKCQQRQSYNNMLCVLCAHIRLDTGLWQCPRCTMVNSCNYERCVACESWSRHLPARYCMDCKTSRVVGTEVRCELCVRNIEWKCRYKTCGMMNKVTEKYCSRCGLWRHNPFGRGDECKRWTVNGIESVWVCHKCESVHSLIALRCLKWCAESRYQEMP